MECRMSNSGKKYILNFQKDQKIRNKELVYLMVVLDKYINLDKPQMLAKHTFLFER